MWHHLNSLECVDFSAPLVARLMPLGQETVACGSGNGARGKGAVAVKVDLIYHGAGQPNSPAGATTFART